MDSSQDLLKQLHIDRRPAAKKRRRRWMVPALAAVVLGVGVVFMSSMRPVTVETTQARAAAELGTASVLDASGYVTARRIATVSSKITGKVLEVLI
ncbi:MAG: efflux RND transporter periplasmic adaptor subunit, partial [Arenimonas sp.]|nr:efflux RND transporter periplasmic adaptor subunit [Arenimonas sp.]